MKPLIIRRSLRAGIPRPRPFAPGEQLARFARGVAVVGQEAREPAKW